MLQEQTGNLFRLRELASGLGQTLNGVYTNVAAASRAVRKIKPELIVFAGLNLLIIGTVSRAARTIFPTSSTVSLLCGLSESAATLVLFYAGFRAYRNARRRYLRYMQEATHPTTTGEQLLLNIGVMTHGLTTALLNQLSISIRTEFHNRTTFINLTPVSEIKPEKLLELDGYAFDIDELENYAKTDLKSIFINPHTERNQEFSYQARREMKKHPVLKPYIIALERKLAAQRFAKIKPETVDAVINMLIKLHETNARFRTQDIDFTNARERSDFLEDGDVTESVLAREDFLKHRNHELTDQELDDLNEFLIEVPLTSTAAYASGTSYQRMKFHDAFIGNRDYNCIKIAQVFLWQFVVTLRPEAMHMVPKAVLRSARKMRLQITPPNHNMPTASLRGLSLFANDENSANAALLIRTLARPRMT